MGLKGISISNRHLRYRDLIECGKTWKGLHADGTPVANLPLAPETWQGLALLAQTLLDPVIETFGRIELTYGFCDAPLARKIVRRIAPSLDQHAGAERRRTGRPICDRGGQAADFIVPGRRSSEVARWIVQTLPFDRLYFYGPDRPLHVSARQFPLGSIVVLHTRGTRQHPQRMTRDTFLRHLKTLDPATP